MKILESVSSDRSFLFSADPHSKCKCPNLQGWIMDGSMDQNRVGKMSIVFFPSTPFIHEDSIPFFPESHCGNWQSLGSPSPHIAPCNLNLPRFSHPDIPRPATTSPTHSSFPFPSLCRPVLIRSPHFLSRPFWAADPKGMMSYSTQGRISVRSNVQANIHPPCPPRGPALRAPAP